MQKWLSDNDILRHAMHNEGTAIVAWRFIRTLKSRIFKKMTTNNKTSYLNYLNKLVYEYNKTCHQKTC